MFFNSPFISRIDLEEVIEVPSHLCEPLSIAVCGRLEYQARFSDIEGTNESTLVAAFQMGRRCHKEFEILSKCW